MKRRRSQNFLSYLILTLIWVSTLKKNYTRHNQLKIEVNIKLYAIKFVTGISQNSIFYINK